MPIVNLIYEQRLAVEQRERQTRMLVLTMVGVGALAFLATGFFLFETARFQLMSGELEARKQKLKPMMDQLAGNQLDLRDMEPRLKTLRDAVKLTEQWNRIMDHVAVNTPGDVWFTSFRSNVSDPARGVQVSFGGYGTTQSAIGELQLRLATSTDLSKVGLRFSQERLIDQARALEFQIDATVTGTEKKPVVKKKDDKAKGAG